ncbi:hypothetical protein HYPSUDRAFT_207003 [Hypholoma sublateritium FD-334 SS-4]|uniref:Uncharacterized protein n=1 Tax=Hypholoma sublateritium (strain FD-334 SS-4) TaxID=945553 RepID=A0A0D2NBH9_HYPSF|nr:hypothetical protein HYPSUDRAFT_207003 [Hypholoma sublateritium FD-334 SS-4]
MQHKAAIWITGAFKTSLTRGVQAIAGLMPIHLHIQKMAWRAHFRTAMLSDTHPTRSFLEPQYCKGALEHPVALNWLSIQERPKLQGAIADTHSEILALTKTFAPCAPEAQPGQRLLDLFPARTVFHLHSEYPEPEPGTPPDTTDLAVYHVWLYENVVEGTIKAHLNSIHNEAHAEPNTVYSATNASVPAEKKYQALVGFALLQGDKWIDSACYASGKVLAPEAELSAIRFAVVWTTQVPGCNHIVIFMDHITSAKKALDPSVHSGQGHSLAVCHLLLVWFNANLLSTLEFYDCPSKAEWDVHHEVHQFLKGLPLVPGLWPRMTLDLLCKYGMDRCNAEWHQLFFRDPTFTGRQFLHMCRIIFNVLHTLDPTWVGLVRYPTLDKSQNCLLAQFRQELDCSDPNSINDMFQKICYFLFAHERHQYPASATQGKFFSPINLFVVFYSMNDHGGFRIASEITTFSKISSFEVLKQVKPYLETGQETPMVFVYNVHCVLRSIRLDKVMLALFHFGLWGGREVTYKDKFIRLSQIRNMHDKEHEHYEAAVSELAFFGEAEWYLPLIS